MLLSDVDQITKAAEFAQTQLDYAANVSFAAYCVTALFLAVLSALAIHFFWIAYPNAKAQRECNEKIAAAVQQCAVTDAAKTQILDDLKDLSIAHANKLSELKRATMEVRCPMLTEPRVPIQPIPILEPVKQ